MMTWSLEMFQYALPMSNKPAPEMDHSPSREARERRVRDKDHGVLAQVA